MKSLFLLKITFIAVMASLTIRQHAIAQQGYRINGAVVDTASKSKLVNATIYVLNAKDSTMRKYVYTTAGGFFSIKDLPQGEFILLATYPDHAQFAEKFSLGAEQQVHDFGAINMPLSARLLQEVIIRGGVTAIKLKGDTTEFNARAYVIQPNDKVEDLLKQLPGLQVDKDGKITANGERVTKVLLDGEEFFGDDPTLVTKNIRADMVDKIQLYDKKSDQATFTGVDDGSKTKTINVKLKPDQNKGAFGKVEAGVGTHDIYFGQALYNRFTASQKYAAYFTAANNGRVNLGMGDNIRLGAGGNNVQVGDIVIPNISRDGDDNFNGNYNGRGLPVAQSGGAHYDTKLNEGRQTINTNYKTSYLAVNGINTTLAEQNLPAGVLNSNSRQNFDNSAFRQKLDFAFTTILDSVSNLKVTAEGFLKNTKTNSNLQAVTTGSSFLNRNMQHQVNNSDVSVLNASLFYTRKLKKEGRTFSWNVSEVFNQTQSDGFHNSTIDYFNPSGATDSTRHIDQRKLITQRILALSSNMTFSESFSKTFSIVANYGLGINNSLADRQSFNQSAPGAYTILDSAFSNKYQFNQLTNQLGALFNYHKDKLILIFGTRASRVNFEQRDRFNGGLYKRDFINWLPQANLQYRLSQQSNFSVGYNGGTVQPTIDQLQPVRVNTDPLNIIVGNPDLQPSFSNSFNGKFRTYQSLSGLYINLSANYAFSPGAIVVKRNTDAGGKTTIQFANLQGAMPQNAALNTVLGFKIKPIDLSVEIELNASAGQSYSYSNNVLNRLQSRSFSGTAWVQKNVAKRYNWSVVAGPSYNVREFSLQRTGNNAAGFFFQANGTVYLPAKFLVSSDLSYNYTAPTTAFNALEITNWNASISRTFLPADQLKISLTANDLLNQNANYSRNITASTITQNYFDAIRQYFTVSVSWDLNQVGDNTSKK
ncbi:MAG: outer membrane beta-barrel protein [Bacteroidota bacterium]